MGTLQSLQVIEMKIWMLVLTVENVTKGNLINVFLFGYSLEWISGEF